MHHVGINELEYSRFYFGFFFVIIEIRNVTGASFIKQTRAENHVEEVVYKTSP